MKTEKIFHFVTNIKVFSKSTVILIINEYEVLMFNFSAFINFINTNNDEKITQKEIKKFQKTQAEPSIFDGYLNSIKNEVNINEFDKGLCEYLESNNIPEGDCVLNFKTKKQETKWLDLVENSDNFKNVMKNFLRNFLRN